MQIAAIIPSRGLVHSRTIESVIANLEYLKEEEWAEENITWEIFFSHDKGIPDAQNYSVEKALEWGADYVWSVEEDMLIPKDSLKRMYHHFRLPQVGVVCLDYPVGQKRFSTVCRKQKRILWCGLGCTLIGSWVFEKIGKPWFSTDKTWKIISKTPLELEEQDVPNKYGGHDIYFGMQCQKHDILIYCVEDMIAGHIKPKVAPARHGHENNEVGEFEIWDTIEQYQNYE